MPSSKVEAKHTSKGETSKVIWVRCFFSNGQRHPHPSSLFSVSLSLDLSLLFLGLSQLHGHSLPLHCLPVPLSWTLPWQCLTCVLWTVLYCCQACGLVCQLWCRAVCWRWLQLVLSGMQSSVTAFPVVREWCAVLCSCTSLAHGLGAWCLRFFSGACVRGTNTMWGWGGGRHRSCLAAQTVGAFVVPPFPESPPFPFPGKKRPWLLIPTCVVVVHMAAVCERRKGSSGRGMAQKRIAYGGGKEGLKQLCRVVWDGEWTTDQEKACAACQVCNITCQVSDCAVWHVWNITCRVSDCAVCQVCNMTCQVSDCCVSSLQYYASGQWLLCVKSVICDPLSQNDR